MGTPMRSALLSVMKMMATEFPVLPERQSPSNTNGAAYKCEQWSRDDTGWLCPTGSTVKHRMSYCPHIPNPSPGQKDAAKEKTKAHSARERGKKRKATGGPLHSDVENHDDRGTWQCAVRWC